MPGGKTRDFAVSLRRYVASDFGKLHVSTVDASLGMRSAPAIGRDQDVDAGELLHILWRRKLTVAAGLLAALVAAAAYLAIMPVKYESSALLLIDPRLGRTLDVERHDGAADSSAIDSQIRLLTSETVLARVAKQLNLSDDPEFNGKARGWISALVFRTPANADADAVDLDALDRAFAIKRPERTYVVEVQATSSDPLKSAALANGLARAYNEDQVEARIEAAANDGKWLRQVLDRTQAESQEAENAVQAYKTRNNVIATEGLRSNEMQVADATRELGLARGRTADARARLDQVEAAVREGRIGSVGEALKSTTVERLRSQQADAEREVAGLARTLGDRHPALQEARDRAARIGALLGDEFRRIAEGARKNYQAALASERQQERDVERLKAQSNVVGRRTVELRRLERVAETLRAKLDELSKVQEGLTREQVDSPPARIVAMARPPVSRSSPRTRPALLIALAAGLFGGMGAALLQESAQRRKRPRGRDEAEMASA